LHAPRNERPYRFWASASAVHDIEPQWINYEYDTDYVLNYPALSRDPMPVCPDIEISALSESLDE